MLLCLEPIGQIIINIRYDVIIWTFSANVLFNISTYTNIDNSSCIIATKQGRRWKKKCFKYHKLTETEYVRIEILKNLIGMKVGDDGITWRYVDVLQNLDK